MPKAIPTDTTAPDAEEANESPHKAAMTAAMHLRDAISSVALLVENSWHDGMTADRARNALDWIAEKMDDDCDALHDALGLLERATRS